MAKAKRSTTTHPRSGRGMQIDSAIYEPFKAAILQSLKGSKGMSFTQLTEAVEKRIRKHWPDFSRSIPWYTITVRLDLETRGMVETFVEKGKKRNRLARK